MADWLAWHEAYADPASSRSRRLVVVQRLLAEALDACPAGPFRIISVCAGQGQDVLPVLRDHARRGDASALLVELDERNVELGRAAAAKAGLDRLVFACSDAALTSSYAGAVPADVILVCGVFGNVPTPDIARIVEHLASLAAPGATVIWTRHRRAPDLTSHVRELLAARGFEEIEFVGDEHFGVGAHRLVAPPLPLDPTLRLFTFNR